jgi:hypothetical protein
MYNIMKLLIHYIYFKSQNIENITYIIYKNLVTTSIDI